MLIISYQHAEHFTQLFVCFELSTSSKKIAVIVLTVKYSFLLLPALLVRFSIVKVLANKSHE